MTKRNQKSENAEPQEITEDESTTAVTNAGPDAQSGGIAEQDVTGTAPASNAGDDVDTNAGR